MRALDVVVGRGGAATARQPVARRGRGELDCEGRYPQHESLVAGERRAGEPEHTGRSTPDDQPLEHVAQPVAAVQEPRRRGVATDLQRDVARREHQPLLAERLGQRGGHEQAREHHRGEHPADRGRGRIEPVGHPGRVDPGPPDDEQQERRPRHAGDGEVAQDLVRQLCDREDVDQVEEQLDRGRRLRDAVAARAQVADRRGHRPGSSLRASAWIRCGARSNSARPARRRRCFSSARWPPGCPRKCWTSTYGVASTAREEPEDDRGHEQGHGNDDDEDRQRRAHQESDEDDGRHLDGAQPSADRDVCLQGQVLDLVPAGRWSCHHLSLVSSELLAPVPMCSSSNDGGAHGGPSVGLETRAPPLRLEPLVSSGQVTSRCPSLWLLVDDRGRRE